MIKVKKLNSETEGEWFDFNIGGEKVSFKIRPVSASVIEKIRKKYTTSKREKDATGRLVRVDYVDNDKVTEELIDYIIEDFKGFGDDAGNPLEPTFENKKLIMEIPPLEDDISIAEFVFDKAKKLAYIIDEEVSEIEKN
ncbi:MAG TPA: hypothetical protein PKV92_08325 [Thermodesulfovibrio thiophilus]|nr:hypothetical protein [Thermodesulfovibrio thiophilus]